MYRVFLISLFILINLCYNAHGGPEGTNEKPDYDIIESDVNEDERNFNEYNDDDVDDEKRSLMGLDYYNGGEGFRNEYLQNSNEEPAQKLMLNAPSNIVVLDSQDARNYKAELLAGNKADVLDANPNYFQPDTYPDFGRRQAIPPFIDVTRTSKKLQADEPVPVWAPPEMVIAIAKESALLNAAEVKNPTDELIRKDILRTGNYWNAFWTEDVNPQLLRQRNEKQLDTMKVEVRPQSELYDLILKLKKISPTLLYVINNTI